MKLDGYSQEIENFIREGDFQKYFPSVYNMMGVVSDSTDNSLMALNYYYTCLQYAEVYQDTGGHAMADYNIAFTLTRMKLYEEAKTRYYSAMEYFEKLEDTALSQKNLVQCMVYCGICHLLSDENAEAYALLERIQDIRRKFPEGNYSELCLLAFEASCEQMKGNRETARLLADKLEAAVFRDENLEDVREIIVVGTHLLLKIGNTERIERLIELLDAKDIENNAAIFLELYPFKSKYLLSKNRREEYITYTKQYFALYQRHRQDSYAVTARILELQDRLSRVELERKDIQAYNRNLESIALYDSLTGLPNRTYLNEYLSQKFEEAAANQTLLGVELMDIDFFKEYNDTYGHLAGDGCLKAVANVLKSVEREKVFCARYGGDEFMIVYNGMSAGEIRGVVERIQRNVRALNILHEGAERENKVTVSQGIFVKVPDEENREWDFNSMADTVLYEAKRQGRNRFHIATDFIDL